MGLFPAPVQTVAEGVVMANEYLFRHDRRFDQQDQRFDRLEVRMGRIKGRMERVEDALLDLAKDVRVLKQDES